MSSIVVRARFEALSVKSGKTVAQLVVDPEDRWALPELSQMVGRMVEATLREDREVLVVDRATGEVAEDAAEPGQEEPGQDAGNVVYLPCAVELPAGDAEEACDEA